MIAEQLPAHLFQKVEYDFLKREKLTLYAGQDGN